MALTSRIIIALVGLSAVGGFIADVLAPGTALRHLRNPMWPPHAKFHNGQGVLMGIGLALLTQWLLFGLQPQSVETLAAGALASALYWLSMLAAILIPGTAWCDPEFVESQLAGVPLPKFAALAFVLVDVIAFACAIKDAVI